MLGQYKKFAIIDGTYNIDFSGDKLYTIPLNLDFTPRRILIHAINPNKTYKLDNNQYTDSKYRIDDFFNGGEYCFRYQVNSYDVILGCIKSFNSDELIIGSTKNSSKILIRDVNLEIIALE